MWYDSGTVAVTNGSTTVTGTGTDFISGAQVGEAFLAPDDKLYEIASITSATVLVLADAYLGSTQSGQGYKIVPTQSLVADLASDVTDLIADYADVKDKAGAGKFNDGSVTSPAITFEQDQNNGLYRIGSDNWGLSAGGQKIIDVSTSGVGVTGTITADGLVVEQATGATLTVKNTTDDVSTVILSNTGSHDTLLKQENGVFTIKDGGLSTGSRLSITDDGDVHLFEDTGTTAKFVWDASAESLGIGTASPIFAFGGGLQIKNSTTANVRITKGTYTGLDLMHGSDGEAYIYNRDNGFIAIGTNNTERARIDSSGNLLVGTTDNNVSFSNTKGIALKDGHAQISQENNGALYLNRKGNNGEILNFRKDGSTVGSIGNVDGDTIYIQGGNQFWGVLLSAPQSGGNGVRLIDNGSTVRKFSPSIDNAYALGGPTDRFKDLYLSGGVYLGGTGAANKLDDYEEGTFTPILKGSSTTGTFTASTNNGGGYVRVGNQVTCWINIGGVLSGAAGNMEVLGLPFNCASRFTTGRKNAAYSTGSLQYWDGVSVQVIAPLSVPATNKIYFHTYGTGNDSTSGASPVVVNGTHNLHCFVTYMID